MERHGQCDLVGAAQLPEHMSQLGQGQRAGSSVDGHGTGEFPQSLG
jgi:hypothetical protein